MNSVNRTGSVLMKQNSVVFKIFSLAIVICLALSPVAAANEDTDGFDEAFFSGNDILYYNPAMTCGDGAKIEPTTNTSAVPAGELARAKVIMQYFVDKGLTLAAAAGFAGNMRQESGLNPAIIQGGAIAKSAKNQSGQVVVSNIYKPVNSVGFGLVQWTFGGTTGPRQGPLYKKAVREKIDIIDFNLQLDYVWTELNSSYKTSTLDRVKGLNDPIEAAIIVHDNYEISADSDSEVREVRGGNAKRYYDQLKGQIDDSTGATVNTTVSTNASGDTCQTADESEGGIGSVDGFTFPLKTTKAALAKGADGAVWKPQKCNLPPLGGLSQGSGGNCHHHYNAADIFAETGTPIVAANSGKVVTVKGTPCGSYGCNVTIMGDDGNLYYYTHMSKTPPVRGGQQVEAGKVIGWVGTNTTAVGTPRHLHIDMLPGGKYKTRPGCASETCQRGYEFIEIQELLIPAYQALPSGGRNV